MVRALVMSGGGAKGAFELGAVETLAEERGLDFDVIAGVSAGALNAWLLAQGAGRDGLRERVAELKRLWFGIRSNRDIYRERFGGKVLALVLKDSVFDPAPLREKIHAHANIAALRASGREFRIGVAWLESGVYECIDQHHSNVMDCTMASSSMPFAFPPVRIGDASGVDGGVRNVTPLENAFHAIKERATSPSDTAEIYVLLASPLTIEPDHRPWKTGLAIGERSLAMLMNEIYREDLSYALVVNEAVRAYAQLRARLEREVGADVADRILREIDFPFAPPRYMEVTLHAIVPQREFSAALEFDPAKIREAYEAGRAAARHPVEEAELAAWLRGSPAKVESKAA
jgi:NTE family protein